jgi:hypothetical protein
MAHENFTTEGVQKPKQVSIAISLLYAYAVISILIDLTLAIIFGYFSIVPFLEKVIIFLVSVFLIFTISKGKAWPRNIFLLFLIWGTFSNLYLLSNIHSFNIIDSIDEVKFKFIISSIKYSLGLIPIILLYRKPAQQWFRTHKSMAEDKTNIDEQKRIARSILLTSLVSAPIFDFLAGAIALPSLIYMCGGMLFSPVLALIFSPIIGWIVIRFFVKTSENIVGIGLLCGFIAGVSAAIIIYPGAC